MKRLGLFSCFILLMVHLSSRNIQSAEMQSSVEVLDLKDCTVINIFLRLWKYSPLVDTEKAIWIIRNPNGSYESREWHRTPERKMQLWEDALPEHIISVAHTHPSNVDPKPSKQDQSAARQLRIAIYTVSRKGIWRVSPDGIITKEENAGWFKGIEEKCQNQMSDKIGPALHHECRE